MTWWQAKRQVAECSIAFRDIEFQKGAQTGISMKKIEVGRTPSVVSGSEYDVVGIVLILQNDVPARVD